MLGILEPEVWHAIIANPFTGACCCLYCRQIACYPDDLHPKGPVVGDCVIHWASPLRMIDVAAYFKDYTRGWDTSGIAKLPEAAAALGQVEPQGDGDLLGRFEAEPAFAPGVEETADARG